MGPLTFLFVMMSRSTMAWPHWACDQHLQITTDQGVFFLWAHPFLRHIFSIRQSHISRNVASTSCRTEAKAARLEAWPVQKRRKEDERQGSRIRVMSGSRNMCSHTNQNRCTDMCSRDMCARLLMHWQIKKISIYYIYIYLSMYHNMKISCCGNF